MLTDTSFTLNVSNNFTSTVASLFLESESDDISDDAKTVSQSLSPIFNDIPAKFPIFSCSPPYRMILFGMLSTLQQYVYIHNKKAIINILLVLFIFPPSNLLLPFFDFLFF